MTVCVKTERCMELLHEGCRQLGIALSSGQEHRFARYLSELDLFNDTLKLVSASSEEIVTRHVLDCIAPVQLFRRALDESGRAAPVVCDLGSGAGMPGIPLAILLEDIRFELVERSARRCGFLLNAVAMCNLSSRVSVSQKDVSELVGIYDVVTFRAFRPLPDILPLIGPLVGPCSKVLAYKGKIEAIHEELLGVNDTLLEGWTTSTIPLRVPFLEADRHMLVLKRTT